jgi:peptidoglycan/xylan/chitin deacetylase (PgdA/CDA1 family)
MKRLPGRVKRLLIGLLPLWALQRIVRRPVVGVFYHAVSDAPMPHVRHLYPPLTSTQFENALLYLKRHYTPVSYAHLHAHVLDGAPLPPNAVHVSFDDGFAGCYTVARPLLLEHAVPCTFFITTDWIDNQRMFYRNKVSLAIEQLGALGADAGSMVFTALNHAFDTRIKTAAQFEAWLRPLVRADEPKIDMACRMLGIDTGAYLAEHAPYMTREQLLGLHEDGFTLGSHTRSHPKLAQVAAAEREAEIVESSRAIQALTGQVAVPFSFPNSGTGLERAELADIRARHALLGLFFDTKGVRLDEAFILNRVWAEKPALAHRRGEATNLARTLRAAYREALGG